MKRCEAVTEISPLRQIRQARGYTIRQVEEQTGINYSTLVSYEKRGIMPGKDKLQVLAEFYGVSTDMILGVAPVGTMPMPVETTNAPNYHDPTLGDIFESFSKLLSPEDMATAIKLNGALVLAELPEGERHQLLGHYLSMKLGKK